MNTEYLKYLEKILELGSISAAAKELYMSQPLLSQKIRQIESDLKITIFNRNTTPISLTFAGERFFISARKIICLTEDLLKEIDEINGEIKGTLRVGISTHRAVQLFPRLLPRFLVKHPEVDIKIVEYTKGKLSEAVMEGQLDMAFVGYSFTNTDLEYVYLDEDRIALVAGNGTEIARKEKQGSMLSLHCAKKERFVSVCEGHGFRESQDAVFQECGIKPMIALTTHTIELAYKLAISCNYVALLPMTFRSGMRDELEDSFYCYISEKGGPARHFGLCYRKKTFLPKYMTDFVNLCKELYRVQNIGN